MTLDDAKNKIAERYGFNSWNDVDFYQIDSINQTTNAPYAAEQLTNEYCEYYASFYKKIYNDLAESHAKQVIEIKELKIQASNFAYESDLAKRDRDNAESELLKAKERFCQCSEDIKTGSTSAMHCNHCGKIEKHETWLK